MKKSTLYLVLGIIVIIVLAFFALSGGEDGIAGDDEENGAMLQSLILALHEQSDSGEAGTAILTAEGDSTLVMLKFAGVSDDLTQPAHIHEGSCGALGDIAYPLTDVSGDGTGEGGSETVIEEDLEDILAQLPLAINVHMSAEDLATSVACGNIVISKEAMEKKDGDAMMEDGDAMMEEKKDGDAMMEDDR
jgi:hypothetical protein